MTHHVLGIDKPRRLLLERQWLVEGNTWSKAYEEEGILIRGYLILADKWHQLELYENLPGLRSAQLGELEHKRGVVEYHLEHGMLSLSRKYRSTSQGESFTRGRMIQAERHSPRY